MGEIAMNRHPHLVVILIHAFAWTSLFIVTSARSVVNDADSGNENDQKMILNDPNYLDDPQEMLSLSQPSRRSALRLSFLKWPKGVVPYKLEEGKYTTRFKNNILAAMRQIEDNTKHRSEMCVRFIPATATEKNSIYIKQSGGCGSPVGMRRNHVVSLDWYCTRVGTIMHELLHVLGLIHEQTRPDRDNYVEIVWSNLKSDSRDQYTKFAANYVDLFGISYDYTSIMHYSPYGYALDKSRPSMVPKSNIDKHTRIGLKNYMSEKDVKRVQMQYKCTVNTTHIKGPADTKKWVDCDFEDGQFCELIQTNNDDFDWQIRKDSTPTPGTGPHADHTNGIGSYAYVEAKGHLNKKAKLITRNVPPGSYCLTFSLFLYGLDGGELNLYMKGRDLKHLETFKSDKNYWETEEIDIRTTSSSYLILEYKVGNGDSSDLAIDDIQLASGSCDDQ